MELSHDDKSSCGKVIGLVLVLLRREFHCSSRGGMRRDAFRCSRAEKGEVFFFPFQEFEERRTIGMS